MEKQIAEIQTNANPHPYGLVFSFLKKVVLVTSGLIASLTGMAQNSETKTVAPTSAEAVFYQMLESTLTGESIDQKVIDTDGKVTYGAEKEGSSSLITRIMGPNKEEVKNYLELKLIPENRGKFLRDFLSHWIKGSYRVNNVVDENGENKDFKYSHRTSSQINKLNDEQVVEVFNEWLELTGDRWFSFVSPSVRRKIFNGELVGQSGNPFGKVVARQSNARFNYWIPLFGSAQKYITNAHNTTVGWEINFNPMPNYAEFIKMQNWFSITLRNAGEDFGLPGHQRLVFPARTKGSPEEIEEIESKLSEIYKNVQAYIVLKGQEGLSGMEVANFKSPATDEGLRNLGGGSRNLLRLEKDRFGKDTYGIEIRGGTKTKSTQRFVQMVIASRYSANDFRGIAPSQSWSLVDESNNWEGELVRRFNLPRQIVRLALENLSHPSSRVRESNRYISSSFRTPFWGWENAPYLSAGKKEALKELTRSFIISAAAWKNPSVSDVLKALQTWAIASNLSVDIKRYVSPAYKKSSSLDSILTFEHPLNRQRIDVNEIDLGIEYTARYPIHLTADYAKNLLKAQTYGWKRTEYDLSPEERKALLEKIAKTMAKEMGTSQATVSFSTESTHGNSLEMAYEFADKLGRTIRVEWDGIGRDYDSEGNVIPGSVRGGHIEVVTPKFVPGATDIQAIFKVFNKMNLVPSIKAGGGHINIDLAPFAGRPEALARFITLFTRHRGIIALMFQHPQRLRSAEPITLSPEAGKTLAQFAGTEEELKQLLYNNEYFNTRLGRKTRYLQMDLSAYFQDVIPDYLIQKDFDIKNDLWRRNFNVEPNVRKIEFRLFNAPADEVEAAFQIRLVRSLLNYALNNQNEHLEWLPQAVDYEAYAKDPALAFDDLDKMAEVLGLNSADYRRYIVDGLATAEQYTESEAYHPLEQQLQNNPRQSGWGKAVAPRGKDEAISAENRLLPPDEKTLSPSSEKLLLERRKDSLTMEKIRERETTESIRTGEIDRNRLNEFVDSIYNFSNRGKLLGDDRLYLIFSNLNGVKAVKAHKVVKQMILKRDEFYQWSATKEKASTEKLKRVEEFGKDFESSIALALDRSDPEFRKWLLTLFDPHQDSTILAGRLVKDQDSEFSKIGENMLRHLSISDLVLTLDHHVSNCTAETQALVLGIIENIPLESWTADHTILLNSWFNEVLYIPKQKNPTKLELQNFSKVIDLGLKILKERFYPSAKWKIFQIIPSNLEMAKISINRFTGMDEMTRPDLVDTALSSPRKEVRNFGWQIIYKKYVPSLLSRNRELREKALSALVESNRPNFIMKVLQAAGMDESKVPGVKEDFYKVFEERGYSSNELQTRLLEKMKAAVIDGTDAEMEKTVIRILSKGYSEKLANVSLELLDHPNSEVRRKASEIFKLTVDAPKKIDIKAFESLDDTDLVYRANAEKRFFGKNLSSTTFALLLDYRIGKDPAAQLKAQKIIERIMNTNSFDYHMSNYLGYSTPYAEEVRKIFENKNFLGFQTIEDRLVSLAHPHLRVIAIEKVKHMNDLDFVIIAQRVLGRSWDEVGVKAILPLLVERDLSQSAFGYSELVEGLFSFIRDNNFRPDIEKILLKVKPEKKDEVFFQRLLSYTHSPSVELLKTLARIAAKNIEHEGTKPTIDALRNSKNPEVIQILDEALAPGRSEYQPGLSCRESLATAG